MYFKRAVLFNSDKEKVWDILVNLAKSKHYMFGCKVFSDWVVGSPFVWKGYSK